MSSLSFVWRLITYKRWLYIANVVLWSLNYLTPILPGLVLHEFFDYLETSTATDQRIVVLMAALVAIAVGRTGIIFFAIWAVFVERFLVGGFLRTNLFNRMLRLSGAQPLADPPGEMVSRFRDDTRFMEDTIDFLLDVIGSLVFTIVALTIMASIDPQMTFVVFVPVLTTLVLARFFSSYVQQYREASRDATEVVSGVIGDAFASVQSVQLAQAEGHVVDRLKRLNAERLRVTVKDRLFSQVLVSIYQNTASLATGLVLLIAVERVSSGSLTVGDLALFVYYMAFASDFIRQLGRYVTIYQQGVVSSKRLQRAMEGAPPQDLVRPVNIFDSVSGTVSEFNEDPPRERLDTLDVRGLTFVYPDSTRGAQDVSFSLQRGTVTVITGRIGSGKSTLVRALLGLLPRQAGEIHWNGNSVTDSGEFFVPPRTAYVPQVPRLFSASVKDNLLLGYDDSGMSVEQALHTAVLNWDIALFPNGLDTLVGPRGVRLSGGQVQRTAAARALLRQPELLVLDDLSSALDVDTEDQLWERIFKADVGACLAISHRRRVLERADNIIVLKDGLVEAQGKLPELLVNCQEMRILWGYAVREGYEDAIS